MLKYSVSPMPSGCRWRLPGAAGEFVAKAAGGGGIAVRAPAETGCVGCGSPSNIPARSRWPAAHRDDQSEFADQRAALGDDFPIAAVLDMDAKGAVLNDVPAVRLVTGAKQDRAAGELRCSEPMASTRKASAPNRRRVGTRSSRTTSSSIDMQDRSAIRRTPKSCFDESIERRDRITAPACSHPLPSPESPDWRRPSRSSGATGRCGFPGCAW